MREKLRVAMFSRVPRRADSPRGGVESVTVALAQQLGATEGVDLHLVTLERGLSAAVVEPFGPATVHRLPGSRWPHVLDILVGPGHWRLRRYLRQLAPDVVHFQEYHGLTIGQLDVPHVYTLHGFDHANIPADGGRMAWLRAPLWRCVEAYGLARQRYMVSISPYVREEIEPLTPAWIFEIDNPLVPAFFDVKRAEVPGRVFFAGWISSRKNPLTLVKAFARIAPELPEAHLHIAGEAKNQDAAYAAALRQTIAAHGLGGRVTLLGRVSQDEIRRQLGQASVFVLPSLQENSPMAIAEAMAVGVPVISSNRCGMPYMIREGETGFLLDPEDVSALADRLAALLADAPRRRAMGQAAREDAVERFHPRAVADRTLEAYRTMLREAAQGLASPPVAAPRT